MRGSKDLDRYCLSEELSASRRLGIEYDHVNQKFMIGYDFDEEFRNAFFENKLKYTLTAESLDAEYARMTAEIPEKQKRPFYFKSQRLISPVYYFTRTWPRKQSAHFDFRIADSTLFHPAAIEQLESFVVRMAMLLGFTEDDLRLLRQQKVIYVLCKDEEQIEQLTGYRSKGIYVMAYDYVITTYSCHYHELLHLLINFKLRRLPLYTHPMLQEGFAVGFGGRGGIAPQTQLQSGAFLVNSSFADYNELLTVEQFRQIDPSLTYPIAGLYVRFLVEQMGIGNFLLLYVKYSGSSDHVRRMTLSAQDLPPEKEWLRFVKAFSERPAIVLSSANPDRKRIVANGTVVISDADEFLHVRMKSTFALRPEVLQSHYTSKRFLEVLPKRQYAGERVLVTVDSNEVVLYDLYTNNSLATYSSGFSSSHQMVKSNDGWWDFWVRKDLVPFPLNRMRIVSDFGNIEIN